MMSWSSKVKNGIYCLFYLTESSNKFVAKNDKSPLIGMKTFNQLRNGPFLTMGVVTIMPELFDALHHGMTQKAIALNKVSLQVWNPREWAERPYCQVDDTPYGGGPGMVMRFEPLDAA